MQLKEYRPPRSNLMQCAVYIGKRRKPVPANKSAVPRFFKQLAGRTPLQSGKRTTVLQTYEPTQNMRPKVALNDLLLVPICKREGLLQATAPDAILESVLLAWSTFS